MVEENLDICLYETPKNDLTSLFKFLANNGKCDLLFVLRAPSGEPFSYFSEVTFFGLGERFSFPKEPHMGFAPARDEAYCLFSIRKEDAFSQIYSTNELLGAFHMAQFRLRLCRE